MTRAVAVTKAVTQLAKNVLSKTKRFFISGSAVAATKNNEMFEKLALLVLF
jgi:hypothetical protein